MDLFCRLRMAFWGAGGMRLLRLLVHRNGNCFRDWVSKFREELWWLDFGQCGILSVMIIFGHWCLRDSKGTPNASHYLQYPWKFCVEYRSSSCDSSIYQKAKMGLPRDNGLKLIQILPIRLQNNVINGLSWKLKYMFGKHNAFQKLGTPNAIITKSSKIPWQYPKGKQWHRKVFQNLSNIHALHNKHTTSMISIQNTSVLWCKVLP